ncbi:hypothetical protein [Roseixanthobacter glucoisosaccharinicivorans]|uniref:hypothetical protein n=1 Tax=Roseixanthobacter glucoisosaccharinicivorans TaxID=3119923 RepID=UPI00372AF296
MTDIVERMRAHITNRGGLSRDADGNLVAPNGAWAMMLEAADEIERLRRELKCGPKAVHIDAEGEFSVEAITILGMDDLSVTQRAYFEKHKEPAE